MLFRSKAIGKLENRFKFNDGAELTNEFDLNLYETSFRGLDPQIGRFWQIDPVADVNAEWGQYVFSNDNPILLNDQLGLDADTVTLPAVIVTPHGNGTMSVVCITCSLNKPNPSKALISGEMRPVPGPGRGPLFTNEDLIYIIAKRLTT